MTCTAAESTRRLFRIGFGRLDSMVGPTVKAGVGSPPLVGTGLVVLETTGRRTGMEREVPLVATRLGSTVFVSTVRTSSDWVKNLITEPQVHLWVDGTQRNAAAQVLLTGPATVVALQLEPETTEATRHSEQ